MRIDVVTIFPAYFDALEISLLGRARQRGLLETHVHDLREAAHDRHRTVDDTPAGGGAGMVMKPEPWGEALDGLLGAAGEEREPGETEPLIVFPSPSGERFTQETARELAAERRLIFGCGRYEGIDQRVFDEYGERGRVRLLSLGDYVLNGGEVAVLAMVEAIARLIPGVVGNPESLVEESHEQGLLEYPVYTKPAVWRGREVPPVLLGGDHGAVEAWRREQSLERTRRVRPDLLGLQAGRAAE
ncbi:tRNA (guanosine(37)-N1)-methyltransferase TrmD [Leucobacter weissii]|uniref:tRNA (guanine-N(1)-)-methyltransferase n=1 Tax=Leucobacter weissii TaxID=1983706 RepID=A0A939SC42_9MICO|nr:tRNA (guanosine(37)-N1)-methyltransferase TrmD [Leucobacter weissii]MBO1902080.1 tRNA (guanosine(37)-N1)-methyltransferase TrmD [Leucobacter weissii]